MQGKHCTTVCTLITHARSRSMLKPEVTSLPFSNYADRFKQWKWIAGGSCGLLLLLIVLSALAAGGGGGARLPDTSHRIYARMLIVG